MNLGNSLGESASSFVVPATLPAVVTEAGNVLSRHRIDSFESHRPGGNRCAPGLCDELLYGFERL